MDARGYQLEKRMPLQKTDFERMRSSDLIYVDKTDLVWDLTELNEPVFLSRPRRFGKTLLLRTFESLFSHGLKYFQGLKIASLWKDSATYPVLFIDFSMAGEDVDGFEKKLMMVIKDECDAKGIAYSPDAESVSVLMMSIARAASPASLVLLIDEYDYPLIANMHNPAAFAKIQSLLREFYAQVKAKSSVFKFIMITGIARFSHTSIFSGFNILHDISFEERYSTLLGFTDAELDSYFKEFFSDFATRTGLSDSRVREQFKNYYDGYYFGETVKASVYNPISVMNAFKNGTKENPFVTWWSNTGGFSSLLNKWLNVDKNLMTTLTALQSVREGSFNPIIKLDQLSAVSELNSMDMTVMLYTAGYLTFKRRVDNKTLLLGYPNLEVREYLAGQFINLLVNRLQSRQLLGNYSFTERQRRIEEALLSRNAPEVRKVLSSCLAQYPYSERKALTSEPGICALLSMALKSAAVNAVYAEHQFMGGRTDLEILIFTGDCPEGITVILEVKLAKYTQHEVAERKVKEALDRAREQLCSRRYQRVALPGTRALCYAVCADFEERDIAAVEYVPTES